jgi:hypothetical protein
MVVSVSPDGTQARARGLELGMLGDVAKTQAYWTLSVFENDYCKGEDGKWRVQAMRLFPMLKSDYYQGWAKSQIGLSPPGQANAPDHATPASDAMTGNGVATPAFFYPNPATGKPVRYPPGVRPVGVLPAFAGAPPAVPRNAGLLNIDMRLREVARKLAVSIGYDGVENISGAFANWMDDAQWTICSEMYAQNGARLEVMDGFYIGPDRINKAELTFFGAPPSPPRTQRCRHQANSQPDISPRPELKCCARPIRRMCRSPIWARANGISKPTANNGQR